MGMATIPRNKKVAIGAMPIVAIGALTKKYPISVAPIGTPVPSSNPATSAPPSRPSLNQARARHHHFIDAPASCLAVAVVPPSCLAATCPDRARARAFHSPTITAPSSRIMPPSVLPASPSVMLRCRLCAVVPNPCSCRRRLTLQQRRHSLPVLSHRAQPLARDPTPHPPSRHYPDRAGYSPTPLT
ncbi:hypothetical protein M0R45_019438 [Rubus argutus]|uniref:Uncharacterized protein n=1 Tax=Rubus argutus TaxID=59490 RepID=A0AAW1X5B9_RUBAR